MSQDELDGRVAAVMSASFMLLFWAVGWPIWIGAFYVIVLALVSLIRYMQS